MATKICKVCGKEYPICINTIKKDYNSTFRWQNVACSPACGSEYFRLVALSRSKTETNSNTEEETCIEELIEDEDEIVSDSIFEEPKEDELWDD